MPHRVQRDVAERREDGLLVRERVLDLLEVGRVHVAAVDPVLVPRHREERCVIGLAEHAIAGPERGDVRADGLDDARRRVAEAHVREVGRVRAGATTLADVVHLGARADLAQRRADEDLVGPDLRNGHIVDVDLSLRIEPQPLAGRAQCHARASLLNDAAMVGAARGRGGPRREDFFIEAHRSAGSTPSRDRA